MHARVRAFDAEPVARLPSEHAQRAEKRAIMLSGTLTDTGDRRL